MLLAALEVLPLAALLAFSFSLAAAAASATLAGTFRSMTVVPSGICGADGSSADVKEPAELSSGKDRNKAAMSSSEAAPAGAGVGAGVGEVGLGAAAACAVPLVGGGGVGRLAGTRASMRTA